MDLLARIGRKLFVAITIDHAEDFVSPFSEAMFPVLIWDHEGHFTRQERGVVARGLLEAGCRYAICGGKNSSEWHDAADWEFVDGHLDDSPEIVDAAHVMTAWHEDESPDDVAFFFVLNTNFDDHDFTHYLVLHVGNSGEKGKVDAAVRKHAHCEHR